MKFIISTYNMLLDESKGAFTNLFKWSAGLKAHYAGGRKLATFNSSLVVDFPYRPFGKQLYYAERMLSDRPTGDHAALQGEKFNWANVCIGVSGVGSSKAFTAIAATGLIGFDTIEQTQVFALDRYGSDGTRQDNLTDWGLAQFTTHYAPLLTSPQG